MRAGATLNFDKAEVFWPQDDASSEKYQKLIGIEANPSHPANDLIAPTFDAKVRMDASMSVIVTPEVSKSREHPGLGRSPPKNCLASLWLTLIIGKYGHPNWRTAFFGYSRDGSSSWLHQLLAII
jgi:hypothetical protein